MTSRILIAAGDETTRHHLQALFKAFTAEVEVAENIEALHVYLKVPRGFDVIILDSGWPGLSIDSVCRLARKEAVNVHSYIIALTESADAVAPLISFSAGADEVVKKPIDIVQFLRACRIGCRLAFLDRRQRLMQEIPVPEEPEKVAAFVPEQTKEKIFIKPIVLNNDPRPPLARHMETALRTYFIELGVLEKDFINIPDDGRNRPQDFIGWQGVFMPDPPQWQDMIFTLSRTMAEALCKMVMPHESPNKDASLLRAVNVFMDGVQNLCHKLFEKEGGPVPVFSPALAVPYFGGIINAGQPICGQIFRFPGFSMNYDFYSTTAATRIKSASAVEPGMVLNENLYTGNRMSLANRGLILSESRLQKIRAEIMPDATFWIIEPSIFARQISTEFLS